jgi:hypothetical protein
MINRVMPSNQENPISIPPTVSTRPHDTRPAPATICLYFNPSWRGIAHSDYRRAGRELEGQPWRTGIAKAISPQGL